MDHPISEELLLKLNTLAQQHEISPDDLLARMIEREEQSTPVNESKQALFCILDENYNFLEVNASWEGLLGYNEEDLINKSVLGIVHSEDKTVTDQILSQLDTQATVKKIKSRLVGSNSQPRWMNWTAAIGKDGRIYVTLNELTQNHDLLDDLSHQHQQLASLVERYQGLVNSQIDLVCRFTPDTRLTFVNEAYCQHFGKSEEELIGQSFLLFGEENSIPAIHERIEELKSNPSPEVSIVSGLNREGQISWVQWVDYGIRDQDGNLVEIQAVGRDITPLYIIQEELHKTIEVLQTIFDHIPLMVGLFGATGEVEFVNRSWEELLGWTLSEIQSHENIIEAYYPDADYREKALEFMGLNNGGWRDFKTTTKDGDEIEAAWMNMHLSDGRAIGIGQDIRDRRQLEEERLRSRRLEHELEKERALAELRERFASIVSHEFRTPLTIIQTSVSYIDRFFERLDKERIHKKLNTVSQQVDYMVALMEDFLTLSSNNYRGVGFNPQLVELTELVDQILENIQMVDSNQHSFDIRLSATLPDHVYLDSRIITHILTNLLSNAIKYSPVSTQVGLQIEIQEQQLIFTIKDEGYGIPQDEQLHIFEPFQRGSNISQFQGTGLGLAIVHQNVEAHGGTIDLESALNQGTSFTVRIPLVTDDDLEQEPAGV